MEGSEGDVTVGDFLGNSVGIPKRAGVFGIREYSAHPED